MLRVDGSVQVEVGERKVGAGQGVQRSSARQGTNYFACLTDATAAAPRSSTEHLAMWASISEVIPSQAALLLKKP